MIFLLSAVELEATSVPEFLCPQRNLTVTVDFYLRLYFDGIEVTDLPNSDVWKQPDVVELPCNTTLITIHGRNDLIYYAAIVASTDDEYILTNSSWKCSNVSQNGWEEIDFDDSAWMNAIEYAYNGEDPWGFAPGISTNASWMWLRQYNGLPNSTYEEMDQEVYCRKRLGKFNSFQ